MGMALSWRAARLVVLVMVGLLAMALTLTSATPAQGEGKESGHVRVAGDDRIDTAANVAETVWTDGARTALIASAANFPDALAAAPLSGVMDAPMLLTSPDRLSERTAQALENLGVEDVYILGAEGAISNAVREDLDAIGFADIIRFGGGDRYATAGFIARFLTNDLEGEEDARFGGKGYRAADLSTVYLASGENFPDALAVSSVAAATRRPMLLTGSQELAYWATLVLEQIEPDRVIVVGGPQAIADHVVEQARQDAGGATVERLYGDDRYATAAAVARHGLAEGLDATAPLWAATGTSFPDALAAGPAAGRQNGTLLVANGTGLTDPTLQFVDEMRCQPEGLVVVGGTAAFSTTAERDLASVIC